jgi:hypothetical protein
MSLSLSSYFLTHDSKYLSSRTPSLPSDMPPNPFEPNVNVYFTDVLYQSIGRSIDELIKYHYLTQVNPASHPDEITLTWMIRKLNAEINKLVTHSVQMLLSADGTQPQHYEHLLRPQGTVNRTINTILKDGLFHILTSHGYTAQPRPPRPDPTSTSDADTNPSNPGPTYYRPPSVPPPLNLPRFTPSPEQRRPDPGPASTRSQLAQQPDIHQPQPTPLPASILQPSPMIESSHTRQESETSNSTDGSQSEGSNSTDGSQSEGSDSTEGSQSDVDMPFLSPEDIPSPNYMFDMPGSDEESEEEDPTISDPSHPNHRPLFTYEPLDRTSGGHFNIVPPRRAEPASPDAPPGTP